MVARARAFLVVERLVEVAAALSVAACGSGGGARIDAGADAQTCACDASVLPTRAVPAAEACAMLDAQLNEFVQGMVCSGVCGIDDACALPPAFVMQVQQMNPHAAETPPEGGMRNLACPTTPASVTVECIEMGTGRRTDGVALGPAGAGVGMGARLAARAALEAASVVAFERLERELRAHGAGPDLLRGARRARRDEVRHAAMTARLARRHGGGPMVDRPPVDRPPPGLPVRALVDVAIENAVEGCVREAYGAVQGLVEATVSPDPGLRRAMRSIARDECRHAKLAWEVHGWAMPRLGPGDRARVRTEMRRALRDIARADARGARLLAAALLPDEQAPLGAMSCFEQERRI